MERCVAHAAANGGNNTRLQTAGGLGGSTLGSAGVGGAGGCTPCLDVQQQCQQVAELSGIKAMSTPLHASPEQSTPVRRAVHSFMATGPGSPALYRHGWFW